MSRRRSFRRRASSRGTGNLDVVLHEHAIPRDASARVGDFSTAVPPRGMEIDFESFPGPRRKRGVRRRIALAENGPGFICAGDRPAIAIKNLNLELVLKINAAVAKRIF